MNDTTQTLLRSILKIGAGYLVARGFTDSSTAELITAGVIALIGVVWGILHRSAAGQSQPVPITRVSLFMALSAGLALALGPGCMINKQFATTTSTNPTNGVVTVQEARSVTAALGDGKAVVEKTRASAGKTSSVGSTGTDLEPKASDTFSGAGQMLGAALKEIQKGP